MIVLVLNPIITHFQTEICINRVCNTLQVNTHLQTTKKVTNKFTSLPKRVVCQYRLDTMQREEKMITSDKNNS